MILHFVFLGSNYNAGRRYGLHFVLNEETISNIQKVANKLIKFENVSYYTVSTKDDSLDSVIAEDNFFKEVYFYNGSKADEINDFMDKISIKTDLISSDILLLILSKKKCSKIELNIYFYHLYCSYLSIFKKPVCNDDVFCFNNGVFGFETLRGNTDFLKPSKDVHFDNPVDCVNLIQKSQKVGILNSYRSIAISKFMHTKENYEVLLELNTIIDSLFKVKIGRLLSSMINKNSPFSKSMCTIENKRKMPRKVVEENYALLFTK